MLTTIALSALSGIAGLAVGASVTSGRGLRGRVNIMERDLSHLFETCVQALPQLSARQDAIEQALPELITRQEVSSAFDRLAAIERQRVAARQAVTAPMPSMEMPPRPPAPSAAEINTALAQQLAALNTRLEQVTSQRMPG